MDRVQNENTCLVSVLKHSTLPKKPRLQMLQNYKENSLRFLCNTNYVLFCTIQTKYAIHLHVLFVSALSGWSTFQCFVCKGNFQKLHKQTDSVIHCCIKHAITYLVKSTHFSFKILLPVQFYRYIGIHLFFCLIFFRLADYLAITTICTGTYFLLICKVLWVGQLLREWTVCKSQT